MNLKSLKISTALIAMLAAAPAFATDTGFGTDEPQSELKRTAKRGSTKATKQHAPKTHTTLKFSSHSGDDVLSEDEDSLRDHGFGKRGERPADLQKRIEENMEFLSEDALAQPRRALAGKPVEELEFISPRKTSLDDFSDDEDRDEHDDTRVEIQKAQKNLKKTTKSHEDSASSSSSDDEDYEGELSPKKGGKEFADYDENEEEGHPYGHRDEDAVLTPEERQALNYIRNGFLDFAAREAGIETQEQFNVFSAANSSIIEKAVLEVLEKVKDHIVSAPTDVVEIVEKPKAPGKTVTAPKAPAKTVTAPKAPAKTVTTPKAAPKTVTAPKAAPKVVTPAPAWTKKAVHAQAQANVASASPTVVKQVFSTLPVMSYALAPKHDTATVQQQFAAMSKTPDATKEALKKAYGKTATNEKVDQALVVGYILKKALNAGKVNQSLMQIDGKKAFAGRFKADLAKAEEFSKMLATVTAYNVDHSFKTVEKSDKSVDLIIWNTHGKCPYATLNFKKVA